MAKTKAYTKFIGPIGSNNGDEDNLVHQSSPAWVLTFITWDVRDTLRAIAQTGKDKSLLQTRNPIVVENDCIQVTVNVNKAMLTDSVNITLLETDVNYSTAIAPGDFVFVNMLNWEKDARRIVNIARSKKLGAINDIDDGFKGIFKVQGVRKTISTDTKTGVKRVVVRINGYAFTEFNNSIYFNPYMLNNSAGSDKEKLLFSTDLIHTYNQLVNPFINPTCQNVISYLISGFIGSGVTDRKITNVKGIPVTTNTHFYMPTEVGTLLGIDNVKAAKDIYTYLFGIQKYDAFSKNTSLARGMNPDFNKPIDRFYYTKAGPCAGTVQFKAEYWNNVNAWSIINQYLNAPLNELYTCFRISPEGSVMPTVVYRQIPFTSELFGQPPFDINAIVTKFLSIPRWRIATSLIINSDLGRDEAARVNFVQIYAQPPADIGRQKIDASMSGQTSSKNFAYDVNDVLRSGLRASVITTTFQDLTAYSDIYVGRRWALIVGDALIGGHLKLNGTIECVGIVDPIAVGDNLEYDGNVYHIEEVVHSCTLNTATGDKTFRTTLKLSYGVSVVDTRSGLAYPEMVHTSGYQNRKGNYLYGNESLPGVSEEQDVSYRPKDPAPGTKDLEKKNHAFAQPGQVIKPNKAKKGQR